MKLSGHDVDLVITRYRERLGRYGYSPKTLGWDKGKQEVRFEMLTSLHECEGKSFLDIGCGFGDLVLTLEKKCSSFRYYGIDLVPDLVEIARQRHAKAHCRFAAMDFLEATIDETFDIGIASGVFNFRLERGDNYAFVRAVMEKALSLCSEGIAFDFLSDKVDYRYEHTFHYSPERILEMGYSFSRNVVLRNDYMPFEFCLFIFKDDSFSKDDTLFNRYKRFSPGKR
ncbi:MAG TPA: class I SAM-dependent methyltransferase [Deltaproteobacteria bacterium]|nr:class I SAM-dependent methyltransferase [Deltaproteobacteria bacterium]HPP80744.1 class I SAM-dependent methyltransferase [Deltaproteobacteria bacterium]